MPRLIVSHEGGTWHHELGTERVLIGRDEQCAVRFNDRSVAPVHCQIVPDGQNWVIENLDSDTFTLVNGRVANYETLHSGDRITVGNFALVFNAQTDFSREQAFFEEGEKADAKTDPSDSQLTKLCGACAELISIMDKTCRHCGVRLDAPISEPKAEWRVREPDGTLSEALTLERLVRRIDEKTVDADTCVSGPGAAALTVISADEEKPSSGETAPSSAETGVKSYRAAEVAPLAKFFGRCQACSTPVDDWQRFCHMCRANLDGTDAEPAERVRENGIVRFFRGLGKAVVVTAAILIIILSLLASGIWRPLAPPSWEAAVDDAGAALRMRLGQLVTPERF